MDFNKQEFMDQFMEMLLAAHTDGFEKGYDKGYMLGLQRCTKEGEPKSSINVYTVESKQAAIVLCKQLMHDPSIQAAYHSTAQQHHHHHPGVLLGMIRTSDGL
jgi:hypothetical protein